MYANMSYKSESTTHLITRSMQGICAFTGWLHIEPNYTLGGLELGFVIWIITYLGTKYIMHYITDDNYAGNGPDTWDHEAFRE